MRALCLVALLPILLLSACAHVAPLNVESPYRDPSTLQKGEILHLATGRLLTEPELLDYLARFPVVYVGESHDSIDDHAVELAVLRGLHERLPGRIAVGLEMLKRPSQAEVDRFIGGELGEKEFQKVWLKNWNDFSYYRDIALFARDNRIPLVALNVDDELKKALRDRGLEGLDPELAKQVPEIDADDPYHRALTDAIMGGHTKGMKNPEAFFRVQLLWDETMAQTAADYLKAAGPGRHLVIFAGSNHVRYGIGIPRRLFRRLPLPYAIVEPYVNPTLVEVPQEKRMDVELPVLPMPSADLYWSVDYRDGETERVRLGIMMEEAGGAGVTIAGVVPGSPAERAGLQKGDVVIGLDGVDVKEPFDVSYQVGLKKVGDAGPVVVRRGEETLTLQVSYDVPKHGK